MFLRSKLLNFNVPIPLLEKFDEKVEMLGVTRTELFLAFMIAIVNDRFTMSFDRPNPANTVKLLKMRGID